MASVLKLLLTSINLAVFVLGAQTQTIVKDNVYNRMATIKGHMEFVSGSDRLKAAGQFVIFQRQGCPDCLVGVYADANGDYKVRVGRGRYKLIAYNPSPPTCDLIAPDQSRYVDAVPRLQDIEFDIKLTAPPER